MNLHAVRGRVSEGIGRGPVRRLADRVRRLEVGVAEERVLLEQLEPQVSALESMVGTLLERRPTQPGGADAGA